MSLLNVHVSRERILVGVDTQATVIASPLPAITGRPPGSTFETSKMFPLVHANVILAGRGAPGFLSCLSHQLSGQMNVDSYDAVTAMLPDLIESTRKMLTQGARQLGVMGDVVGGQEIVCAGWSQRTATFEAKAYVTDPGKAVEVWEIDEWVEPWWSERIGAAPSPYTHAAMAQVAARQVAELREHHPAEHGAGGRLLVAELTRSGVNIRTVCALG